MRNAPSATYPRGQSFSAPTAHKVSRGVHDVFQMHRAEEALRDAGKACGIVWRRRISWWSEDREGVLTFLEPHRGIFVDVKRGLCVKSGGLMDSLGGSGSLTLLSREGSEGRDFVFASKEK